jgi:hypothetical protein
MESTSSRNLQIFSLTADLISKQDFTMAIISFYDENHSKFSDTDENKLEYSAIHESFV